jgi:glycosyltransferase involved in cell wall biosynthesis
MQAESGRETSILRVLHVASGDLWAGAEVALFHLASALAANPAVNIGVVLLNDGELAKRLRHAHIPVYILDEQEHGVARLLLQLDTVVRHFRPRIIHSHRAKEHLLGALAALPRPGLISLRTVHGSTENPSGREPGLRDFIRRWLDRHIAGLQHGAIAVSAPLAAELATTLPGLPVRTIANGVSCAAIQAAAAEPSELVTPDRIGICFSGRLVPVKRVELFLAAARLVLDAHPERYRFYVLGDGPLRGQLEAQASQLQLGGDCVFAGFLPNALPALRHMAALLLTSDHEGTPMVALEALALGVPVVAHAVGGLVPLVRSAAQGQLVGSQDPGAIAQAILAVAPPGQQPATERRNLLPAEYRIETCAATHLALYRELLGQTPERR